MDRDTKKQVDRAARAILDADAMVIGAGAGMGVDSGLPDFRGPEGFWRAYPAYKKHRVGFTAIANAEQFRRDPHLAWGFYGHRTNLYRSTKPHEGFQILKRWADGMHCGSFVYTSNVDNHFQKAGFSYGQVVECHGSIEHHQCLAECGSGIFAADQTAIQVDQVTFRASDPLPSCHRCGGLARPNILMFGDSEWYGGRTKNQQKSMSEWLGQVVHREIVIIELGAGTTIPSVRGACEGLVEDLGATMVRINPRESEVPRGQVSIPLGALDGIRMIQTAMGQLTKVEH